nr:MAG TPA: hypothetical protein [Caudoviricetes sp.]
MKKTTGTPAVFFISRRDSPGLVSGWTGDLLPAGIFFFISEKGACDGKNDRATATILRGIPD